MSGETSGGESASRAAERQSPFLLVSQTSFPVCFASRRVSNGPQKHESGRSDSAGTQSAHYACTAMLVQIFLMRETLDTSEGSCGHRPRLVITTHGIDLSDACLLLLLFFLLRPIQSDSHLNCVETLIS